MKVRRLTGKTAAVLLLLAAVLTGMAGFKITADASVDKLNISQIIQKGNDVYLYVNALDSAGAPAQDAIAAEQFSVNIDKKETFAVQDAAVFQSLNQGVSYVFCVDISKSVTEQELNDIREGISGFLSSMSANDYAEIITIGTEITSVCGPTQSQGELSAALEGLERTANQTYLYEGLSYALNGQRKKVDSMPERAAIVVFTDGMDDSDGAASEEQVLVDIAETRIPIYVIGVKGNDEDANLNSVGQIARQSGGRVISYNDMSVPEAVQTVGDMMRGSYQLHVRPASESFGANNLVWTAACNLNGYSVSSTNYVYSLGLDGVELETEPVETESETEAEVVEVQVVTETEPETEPEPTFADFVQENLIILVASGFILLALIILIVSLLRRRQKKDAFELELFSLNSGSSSANQYESTLEDTQYNGADTEEETVSAFDSYDDEETIDGREDRGIRLEFEIMFGGRTETEERVLMDQLVLGRGSECDVDVVLHSSSEERRQTSRNHAFILNRPDGLYVKDNSRNKTYLNGVEVAGEMALRDEDVLQLGRATVKIKILSF